MALHFGPQTADRRPRDVLRKLELDDFCSSPSATTTIPFYACGNKHLLTFSTLHDIVTVYGLSALIFMPGQVPKSVSRALIRRNATLQGFEWTSCIACGRELIGVYASIDRSKLTSQILVGYVHSMVNELEDATHWRLR